MKKTATTWNPQSAALIDGVEVTTGQKLVIEGEAGSYVFRHVSKDGSMTCWGGESQHESWRSFSADRCHLPGWVAPAKAEHQEEKTSRASKYAAFELWAEANQGKTFSLVDLIAVSGFSAPTMQKYLANSVQFEKVKRGLWRVLIIADKKGEN